MKTLKNYCEYVRSIDSAGFSLCVYRREDRYTLVEYDESSHIFLSVLPGDQPRDRGRWMGGIDYVTSCNYSRGYVNFVLRDIVRRGNGEKYRVNGNYDETERE